MSRTTSLLRGAGAYDNMAKNGIGLDEQRLVVSPRRAMLMLDCGRTHVYELIARGELDSYRDGGRKITVESIHRYIERRLTQVGPDCRT